MYKITSKFMQQEAFRFSPHYGIDFKMETGTPIRSLQEGIVELHDYGRANAGKCIKVKWESGETAIYGHLDSFSVENGQHVNPGELLGYSGNTGFSTGSHLHFGLKDSNNQFIDPSPYINDIQNMNSPDFIAHTTQTKITFFDFFQQHMEILTSQLTELKLNFIHLIISSDNFPLIQLLKNIVQFIFFNS